MSKIHANVTYEHNRKMEAFLNLWKELSNDLEIQMSKNFNDKLNEKQNIILNAEKDMAVLKKQIIVMGQDKKTFEKQLEAFSLVNSQ